MQGYFIAPATAAYRFHLTCDDICELRMGLNTSDPLNTTQIAKRNSWTGRRTYFRTGATVSEWHNLTKGKEYYLWSRYMDSGWGDNFAIGLEINQTAINNDNYIADHHHAMKEIQYIEYGVNDSKFETFKITIDDVQKGGTYVLRYQNPDNLEWTNSEQVTVGGDIWHVRR